MTLIAKTLASAGFVAALAACESGSNEVVDFATLSMNADTLQSKYTDGNGNLLAGQSRSAPADIPASGTANYAGYVAGDVDGSSLVGELTIEAAFATNTISSTATNFIHETDGDYTGDLTGSGPLTRTPPAGVPQVSTTLDGTLSNAGTDYATTIALEGDLTANGSDPVGTVAGVADGLVGADFFSGVFAAER